MGKKDGKKMDKEKLEAKKLRQAAKQMKTTSKRVKKEVKESGEDDIEAIIAEFSAKDAARVAVTITPCEQPSPRANFSMTALPNGEMLLFGGEFCDGEGTEVYNNLYRWNMEKNEWKHIESLNTPPPRCSHQAVYYKDKLYVFGGEYATLDQFHHYRDFWELDLKTSTWTEIKSTGDAPNARSGHRMVVWRNFLVLFGGFYEAMREVRWYNDLYLYSFQERRWVAVPHKANTQVPKPRSGVQMYVQSSEDCLYVYGGYSKEKVTAGGSKKEGKVHEDMWCLNLKPMITATGGGGGGGSGGSGATASRAGGISGVDTSKAAWQKISRKGDYPSARCGSGMTMYKNKALLFGGVFDDEGPRHSLVSTFYNDLFAFDTERRRWYKLGLKQKKNKVKLTSADKKARRALKQSAKELSGEGGDSDDDGDDDDNNDNDESDDEDEDEDDEDANALSANSALDAMQANRKGNFFGYIDETGAVVYIDMNAEEEDDEGEGESGVGQVESAVGAMKIGETAFDLPTVAAAAAVVAAVTTETAASAVTVAEAPTESAAFGPSAEEIRQAESAKNQEKYTRKQQQQNNSNNNNKGRERAELDGYLQLDGDGTVEAGAELSPEEAARVAAERAQVAATQSFVARYFSEQTVPCTRINPCMVIRGNTLYVYGGVTELGDIEVTLDDCWSLDLNKRDTWKKVLGGSMHTLVWKGVEDDNCSSSHYSGMDSGSDDDDDEDDDDDDDEDSDDDEEDDDDEGDKKKKKKSHKLRDADPSDKKGSGKSKSKSHNSSGGGGGGGGSSGRDSKGGLRAEMEGLRSHFDMTDSSRTPLAEETLRQFYARTTEHWAQAVIAEWHAKQEAAAAAGEIVNKSETLSEKEIKRQGFALAELRYNELLPLLARLNELEMQQREEEEHHSRKSGGGGDRGKGKSSSSSKNR